MYGHVEQPGTPDSDGVILGMNEERYSFARADWRSDTPPQAGDKVEFSMDGMRAMAILPQVTLSPLRRPDGGRDGVDAPSWLSEMTSFSWSWFLFSLQGRIPRAWFLQRFLVPFLLLLTVIFTIFTIFAVQSGTITDATAPSALAGFIFYGRLISAWPMLAVQVKRLHDRDRPTWLPVAVMIGKVAFTFVDRFEIALPAVALDSVVALLNVLSIWLLIECLFLRGTVGPNRYGPDPLQGRR